MEKVKQLAAEVKSEINKVVIGQDQVIDGLLVGILTGGHVLLEGPPGTAKTLIAKALAHTLAASYKRVQFTPDLMPLDLIGTNIFDFKNQYFLFKPGPIFTDILLADEINRTPPKTQAALLEAMEEKQVTIDGVLKPLSSIFTVIATQNPIEYEGTFPLPEAQLDRFLLKLPVVYPENETAIYQRYQQGLVNEFDLSQLQRVLNETKILEARRCIAEVKVRAEIINYVYEIIKATRISPLLSLGGSPRAGIALILAAKAVAGMAGRDYLIPEDIQEVAGPVLRHRLILKPEALIDQKTTDTIVKNLLAEIKVPR